MKAVRSVIASNGVPFLQMTSIGSGSMSGREKEGKKERMDIISLSMPEAAVHGAMTCGQKALS